MATKFPLNIPSLPFLLLLPLLLPTLIAAHGKDLPPKFFNVVRYGAVADGATDNSQVHFIFLELLFTIWKEEFFSDQTAIWFYFFIFFGIVLGIS